MAAASLFLAPVSPHRAPRLLPFFRQRLHKHALRPLAASLVLHRPRSSHANHANDARPPTSALPGPSRVALGSSFEAQCAQLLQDSCGVDCVVCGGTADGGVDIAGHWALPNHDAHSTTGRQQQEAREEDQEADREAEAGAEAEAAVEVEVEVAVQCKFTRHKVPVGQLREFSGALSNYRLCGSIRPATGNVRGRLGVFLAPNGFTQPALQHARMSAVPLVIATVEGDSLTSVVLNASARRLLPHLSVARVHRPRFGRDCVAFAWRGRLLARDI